MQNKKKYHTARKKSNLIKIGEVLPVVKEKLGVDKAINLKALREIWPLITSFDIAKYSQPAYFDKSGNLVISVKIPALASELSMVKTAILGKLQKAINATGIEFTDIRFINKS